MSEDLFDSLLPPIKSTTNEPIKVDKQEKKVEIDLNKIWEDINQGSEEIGNKRKLLMEEVDTETERRENIMRRRLTHLQDRNVVRMIDNANQMRNAQLLMQQMVGNVQIVNNNEPEVNEVIDEEEGRINSEIYSQYQPAKLKKGTIHPYPVVESSSLSSVEPPNIRYNLRLPSSVIEHGLLSRVQLEAVIYACQRHEERLPNGERAGYLIGDGAGVGKGRILAAIIYENYLRHRKRAIWLSASSDLRHDAERDFKDLGAYCDESDLGIKIYPLNKMRYAKINSPVNGSVKKGVLYCTYASLIGECQANNSNNISKYKTRFKQISQWFGSDYDGVIVFDECHKAKNLMPQGSQKKTKTADLVLRLQIALPNARIVYASATGASEPRNMAYMTRLGLWGKGTPFGRFEDFVEKLEDKVGAMELIAVDMKQRGMYIARQLSFANVTFQVHEVGLDKVKLGDWSFMEIYDESVQLWNKLQASVLKILNLQGPSGRSKCAKTIWGQYWAAHQRFFKYLVMAGKVQEAVGITMDAISQQKCVVIGLQSTGEAKTNEMLEDMEVGGTLGGELGEFVSCARGILQSFIERFFPTRSNLMNLENGAANKKSGFSAGGNNKRGNKSSGGTGGLKLQDALPRDFLEKLRNDGDDNASDNGNLMGIGEDGDDDDDDFVGDDLDGDLDVDLDDDMDEDLLGGGDNGGVEFRCMGADEVDVDRLARSLQTDLMLDLNRLGPKLPINTLDALIRELGGTEYVAEMTGRKGRMVMDPHTGEVSYQPRREPDVTLEQVNLVEKERFNSCKKLVAIISDAASTGISLHSDLRYPNPLPRVHITLELPWSADRAVQQFGRTHRSNQAHPPHYILLISDLAGERRFASTVAKRLESLGALTHGDRRASESRDLSRFNVDNKFGRKALDLVFDHVFKQRPSLVPWKHNQTIDLMVSMETVGLQAKDSKNVSKFLNRILGMPLLTQNAIFQFYTDTIDELVRQAKRNQEYDRGIIDLAKEDDSIFVEDVRDFQMHFLGDDIKVQLHRVKSITGMSWSSSLQVYNTTVNAKGSSDKKAKKPGYFWSKQVNSRRIILAVPDTDTPTASGGESTSSSEPSVNPSKFRIYSPNAGEHTTKLDWRQIVSIYERVADFTQAEKFWTQLYQATENQCLHIFWNGHCRGHHNSSNSCEYGKRSKIRYVLSGSIFYIWDIIGQMHRNTQLTRVQLNDGSRIIGCLISAANKDRIIDILHNRTTTAGATGATVPQTTATTSRPPVSLTGAMTTSSGHYGAGGGMGAVPGLMMTSSALGGGGGGSHYGSLMTSSATPPLNNIMLGGSLTSHGGGTGTQPIIMRTPISSTSIRPATRIIQLSSNHNSPIINSSNSTNHSASPIRIIMTSSNQAVNHNNHSQLTQNSTFRPLTATTNATLVQHHPNIQIIRSNVSQNPTFIHHNTPNGSITNNNHNHINTTANFPNITHIYPTMPPK